MFDELSFQDVKTAWLAVTSEHGLFSQKKIKYQSIFCPPLMISFYVGEPGSLHMYKYSYTNMLIFMLSSYICSS